MAVNRNDPCPCGSGKKYKKCCLAQESAAEVIEAGWLRMRRAERDLVKNLTRHLVRFYGPDPLDEAWQEYTLWLEPPAAQDEWPEFETSFLPWLVFDWEPEPDHPDRDVELPAISPARHYAQSKGKSLDSYQHRYIEAVCSQPTTFYLVVDVSPGRAIMLRDILRQGEVTVHERQASTTLRPGQIVFTRVVELDGDAVMLGCAPYAIAGRHFDEVVTMREYIAQHRHQRHAITAETLRKFDVELRKLYLDLREDSADPAPPRLRNTDGDPLQMTRIDYDLGCSPQEAFTALFPLTTREDPADFADRYEHDEAGELVAAQIPWLKTGNRQHRSWPNTILGQIDIQGARLSVEVNSQPRAEAFRAEIEARLGPRARQKAVVIQSPEQMLAAAATGGSTGALAEREHERDAPARPPEVEAIRARLLADHWRTWPDTPLPALRGQTPREAAANPAGRELLDVLLLEFASRDDVPEDLRPDVAALRRELGM